ncbi:response regulator [Noviherbaspirillum pedocola]|uniref:Response regulator n=1 Tax=Noviherbaspirillum pedocola TaxID=2801341 RepID=A0A934SRA7_9BURK|nr:response regulator [Noviherbaspirillum pedocola]MBK4733686.1 response regulator [Noviherbaspirillum pedocola]
MLKAVIFDNNAIARSLLRTVLTDGGHDVVADSNINPTNLARGRMLAPHILFMDSGGDTANLDALSELRTALPKTVIFLVSSGFTAEVIQEAAQRGVNGFIVKPFNGATVLSTIRTTVLKLVAKQKAAAG